MSQHSTNISSVADSLWRELLRSYLNVAAVGVLLIIISAAATFVLRYYANQLATIHTPITKTSGQLQTGLQESIANLHGWISIENRLFIENRNKVWNEKIYPAIKELKKLKQNDIQMQRSLTTLEVELYNLDMWQWVIEDVAQTLGNQPANVLVKQTIVPLTDSMFSAINAMADIAIAARNFTTLKNLLNIRTSLYQADKHLINYVEQGSQFDKDYHIKLLAEIDNAGEQLDFDKSSRDDEIKEQFSVFKNTFAMYQSLAHETILIRQSANWNVAQHLLTSSVLPLQQKISTQLNAISTNEQIHAAHVAAMVNQVAWWIPFITAFLLILMIYISYRMANKESQLFIQPVMELESTKEKVTRALSESKKLNIRLNRNTRRTQIIIESSPVSIITVNQRGLIQTFNVAAVKSFGYSKLEVINKKASMLIPTGLIEYYERYLQHFLQTGETEFFGKGQEIVALRKDNTEIHVQLSIAKMKLEDEILFLGMVTDITNEVMRRLKIIEANEKLKNQQEQLRATNEQLIIKSEALENTRKLTEQKSKELEQASRYKSEFLANMSHELRTPLNSLLILSNSLAENDEGNLSIDEVESASVIQESGQHLLGLINEILDLSKVEAGKMLVQRNLINFSILSKALSNRFKHMAEVKLIGFSINIAKDVPAEIWSDEKKLNQILTNLISNAIKFTSLGEVSLNIEYIKSPGSLDGQDTLLSFSIVDSGVGIAKQHRAAVFEAFQQADGSTSRLYGGTGLGLSIARTFAELLGGKLELESELGTGSTFTLILPEHPLEAASKPEINPAQIVFGSASEVTEKTIVKSVSSQQNLQDEIQQFNNSSHKSVDNEEKKLTGKVVLLVDDDIRNTFALAKVLRKKQLIVHIASSAKDALASLDKYHDIDIVLMDNMMPEMDGYEAMRLIRQQQNFSELPIIALTAKAMAGDKEKCLKMGANDYLTKPVDLQKLLLMMKNLLGHR